MRERRERGVRDGLAQKTKWKVAGPSLINNVDTFSPVGVVLYVRSGSGLLVR